MKKIAAILAQLIIQGLEPKKLASALSGTALLSLLPLLGITSIIVLVIGSWRKWNPALILALNFIVYPLQVILWLPQIRLGMWLCNYQPHWSEVEIWTNFTNNPWRFLINQAWEQIYGIPIWMGFSLVLYFPFRILSLKGIYWWQRKNV